jgi:hypothetical protein
MSLWKNKKITRLVIVCVILIGATGFYAYQKNKLPKISGQLLAGITTSSKNFSDLDKDGLPDWEELLWGTNKNLSDTDGDGTNDGDEVVAGRNPAKRGPDDKSDDRKVTLPSTFSINTSAILESSLTSETGEETVSSKVVKEVVTSYALLKGGESGIENNSVSILDFVSQVKFEDVPPKYSLSDFKIVENSTSTVKTYGSNVVTLSAYPPSNTLELFNKAVLENNTKAGSELIKNANIFRVASESFAKLPVPKELESFNLQSTNNWNGMSVGVTELASYKEDPFKAILGLRKYYQYMMLQLQNVKKMKKYFDDSGIIWSESESGYFWNQIKF